MSSKIFYAPLLLALLLSSPAHASDEHLMVYYGCDAFHNRLTVKTIVSTEEPFDTKRDDLPFLWLNKVGMVMECPFESGDNIFIQSMYGQGGKQYVAIYANDIRLERVLEFNAERPQTVHVTGSKHRQLSVRYSKK